MSWFGGELHGKLSFMVEYRTKLFKKETLEDFISYFKQILSTVIKNKEIKLGDIQLSHGLLSPEPEVPEMALRL